MIIFGDWQLWRHRSLSLYEEKALVNIYIYWDITWVWNNMRVGIYIFGPTIPLNRIIVFDSKNQWEIIASLLCTGKKKHLQNGRISLRY